MRTILTLILFTGIPYVPHKKHKRPIQIGQAYETQFVFDTMIVDDRGFRNYYLNGELILTY